MKPVYAVLLAAGESKRCRPNKLFLPWGDTTVLERSVDNLLDSSLSGTVVVLGHQADRAAALLEGKGCRLANNPDYSEGMGSSVIRGVAYCLENLIGEEAAGIMLALGDEPFIEREVIDRLVSSFRESSKGIVVPAYRGRKGHPPIFHSRYAVEMMEAAKRTGVRELLRRYPDEVAEVEVGTETILLDIDTKEDYERLFNKFISQGSTDTAE